MKLDPIALAIPAFFLLIGVEVFFMRRRGLRLYRFNDSVTDLSCGIGSELVRVFLNAAALLLYAWVYENYKVIDLAPYPIAAWVAGFFLLDFLYYWFHRWSHEVNFLWAMHLVHHQSQDYNLAVALRQSWFQGVAATALYLPMALLGVPPLIYIGNVAISLLYQFWIHTQLVGKLPRWYEFVFNTPSHHRVHHGINPEYIDRNHGGIFIIWDRMFGTFEPERATPVYGLVKPFESWNPVWANFHYWKEMWERAGKATRLRDKIWTWFANPAWLPADQGGWQTVPPVEADKFTKWDPPFSGRLKNFVNVQFAFVGATVTATLLFQHQLAAQVIAVPCAVLLLATVGWGALFEGKSWAWGLEYFVHAAIVAASVFAWFLAPIQFRPVALGVGALALAGMAWASSMQRRLAG